MHILYIGKCNGRFMTYFEDGIYSPPTTCPTLKLVVVLAINVCLCYILYLYFYGALLVQ